ncbi:MULTISPECIES: SDR family oxidoreductase [unclassified Bordetella]|uniref:SDR family oxidoreductase n=1 Tax=unclassified Bordetella TaxID=2630031 RepID=UPI0013245140|nr:MULTISPECIES: SDR family oxidoreductase [unclassified Bordetella]MVW71116.1 SDR family oxidoreductase [Bordetella sp. 15P40C-2]MVW80685.1 SDR family oxidoreductase [Bordetella sp. 02P26C-1]
MDLQLKGKKVLITGASQGIGEGLAYAFAEEGCDLHLTARSEEKLETLQRQISEQHAVAVTTTAIDMTTSGACERIVDEAGDIDVLVNNAGVIPSGTIFDLDAQKWRDGWALKGFGYADMIRLVYPRMKRRGGGVILNNIGNGGEVCDPNYIAGAAGNASLMAMTRALGGSSLDDNIRVVGVNPGPVDTTRIYNMLKKFAENRLGDAGRYEELLERYPLGRPAKVHEITDLFLFLASFRSGYTSGTIFTVDGGIASRRAVV